MYQKCSYGASEIHKIRKTVSKRYNSQSVFVKVDRAGNSRLSPRREEDRD